VKLFLDSSVLLAAAGSSKGASRLVIELADAQGWTLLSAFYCLEETRRNLPKLTETAPADFDQIVCPAVAFRTTQWVVDRPVLSSATKDKPVLASALAYDCEVLLTLDRADFQNLLGTQFYGLRLLTPGDWLRLWRG